MGSDRNDKGTGQGVVEQVFVSENIWRALILISTAAVLLFSVYCLSHGITTVFMHLYYFPIVLLAYRYRYRGFVLATLLSIAYVMLVYIYDFGQPDIIAGAWYRLIVFVGIAAIVAYLSEQLALAPMFQKESANTIKKMYHALLSENVWRALILVSSAAVILFSIYCLSQGITIIFMHLYYFPIVLLAYRYRYRGLVLSTLLSLVYVGLVVYFHPEQDEVIGALCRFAVFVGIAAVVAYLSERLAVVHLSQKERLETIQNLQQFQESVIANAHIWITVLDPDGTIIVWNTAAETISGYKQGEVQGKRTIWGNLYPDKAYRQKVTREIHRIIKQETYLENFETEIRCADGTQKTIVWNTRGIRNEDGSIRSYIAIGRDITEHKKVEGALQLTNAILTSQTEAAIDGILVVDEAGKIISYNHRFIEIWEIPPDVIASRSDERALQSVLDKLVDPEEFLARVRYLYTHREEKSKEEIRLNDERILDRYSAPMIGSDGRYYGRVWYFHDISDRKKAEQEIARTAREWETTFNATSDGICLIDADQNLIRCNNRMGEILGGMKQEDLAGKPCWAVVHKTTGPIPECPFVSAKKTLKRTRIEIPAGDLWFEVTADPIFNSSGTFTGAVHIMRDITERKHAEAALLESEEKYRMLFENMQDGFAYCRMIFDSAGHPEDFIYLNVNSAFDRITGTKTVTMKRVTEVYPGIKEAFPELFLIYGRVVLTGIPESFEIDFKPIGKWLHISVYSPAKEYFVAVFEDITERKRAEEGLYKANKQLNLLSSITRHDILNQLMALKGYLFLSKEMIDNPTTLTGYIQKEEQAANTIEHQIKFTKDYQELGITAPEWQTVNASINKALSNLPMRDVRVEIDPKNPEVFADRLFEKVFYNLIDNALKYGGDQMKTIRVSSQESDMSLVIVCEDDGVGISAEDKKKLFTKGFGKNTGLGLFLSREILAITAITIMENGMPGKGARFEITVPKGMWRMNGASA